MRCTTLDVATQCMLDVTGELSNPGQHKQYRSVTCVDARLDHPAEAVSGPAPRRCVCRQAAGGAARDWQQLHKVVQL